jgi:hypothetical protein
MPEISMKVLVSRPSALPGYAPVELRRPDFCWTLDGEVLTLPDFPCADADACGCGRSFAGVSSARATSWGLVEVRTVRSIASDVRSGKHLAGWAVVDGFYGHILAGIRSISERIQQLPQGSTVGIWALGDDRFSLFDRSPPRVETPFNEAAFRMDDREEDDPPQLVKHPGFT